MRIKLLFVCILLVGVSLRVMSYVWNDRIQGDVNLFALTTREFIEDDRLYYPMKYEYSEQADYLTLSSPASQHPPLVIVIVGMFGKLVGSTDAFTLLKLFAEVGGLLLLIAVLWMGLQTVGLWQVAISSGFAAISPMLVDYSANGSPYILVALLLLLVIALLDRFQHSKLSHYILAGLLSGVGLQVHGLMVCLPITFLLFWVIVDRSQLSYRGLAVFAVTMIVILLPWMLWNWRHFGRLFYSYSSYYYADFLGGMRFGIVDGVVENRVEWTPDFTAIAKYLLIMIPQSAALFLGAFVLEVGPFGVILLAIGVRQLARHDRRRAMVWFLPLVSYYALSAAWPMFKYRFLVAILAPTYVFIAIGFAQLHHLRRRTASILLIGTVLWAAAGFFGEPLTRYYRFDTNEDVEADRLARSLAETIGDQREPDVMLGVTRERGCMFGTAYYHRFPFVCAANMIDREQAIPFEVTEKLIRDFQVRYIWTDTETLPDIQTSVPNARIIYQNEMFYILEISSTQSVAGIPEENLHR